MDDDELLNMELDLDDSFMSTDSSKKSDFMLSASITFIEACKMGNLGIAQYIYSQQPEDTDILKNNFSFDMAAHYGHLNILEWLAELKPELWNTETAFIDACENGHFNVADWLYTHDVIDDDNVMMKALKATLKNGHMNIGQWLIQMHPKLSQSVLIDEMFKEACELKRHQTAKWLLSVKPALNKTGTICGSVIRYTPIIQIELKQGPFPITNETKAFDPIMFEDVNLLGFINESSDHIAIFNHDKYYAINKQNMRQPLNLAMKNNSIVYECREAGTLRPGNIVSQIPLAKVSLTGIPEENKYVLAGKLTFILEKTAKIFMFVPDNSRVLASVVSDAVLNHQASHVSAAHCQAGQGGQLYDIVKCPIREPAVGGGKRMNHVVGGKQKTHKRKTKRNKTKRKN
jgi:ligand-binding SRPBCC domain-containing protein